MDKARIRPIVICLFRRAGRILVSEAFDSTKGEYFCRPRLVPENLGALLEGL